MAKYFLHVKIFSRANGSRVTKAAAYRAGERMRDERTGESYNYSSREDVAFKEIVLPSKIAHCEEMNWARDRSRLWNAAEHAGRLRNSRLARDVLVALPPELNPDQRVRLARRFAQELSDKYLNAVDLAVHHPRAGSDERHHHAHLLMTTRQVTAAGVGARTTLELSGTERHERGLGPSKDDLLQIRKRWAEVTNDALQEAGLSARVDHRSYRAQGIDLEPTPMMPQNITYQERWTGRKNPAGEQIRARYRERIEARRQGPEALAEVIRCQNAQAHADAGRRAEERAMLPLKIARGSLTKEQMKAHDREVAKRYRETLKEQPPELREARRIEYNRRQRAFYKAAAPARAAAKAAKVALKAQERQRLAPGPAKGVVGAAAEQSVQRWLKRRGQYAEPESTRPSNRQRSRDLDPGRAVSSPDKKRPTGRRRGHDLSM